MLKPNGSLSVKWTRKISNNSFSFDKYRFAVEIKLIHSVLKSRMNTNLLPSVLTIVYGSCCYILTRLLMYSQESRSVSFNYS
jgi:hypothetical protein